MTISAANCRVLARRLLLAAFAAAIPLHPAAAGDPGDDSYMTRVLSCKGEDAAMELYLPQSIALRGDAILDMRPTLGWYALDLTGAGKGKPLEPVRVRISADKKFVIVDQYTRGHPPTRIPVGGGVVDFDQRFGKRAKCAEFNSRE